jgi:asparagine synthase (glutamine-hydrolysing)
VVSLSGGLDSRAVAAGLRREEIPFTTATFLNSQQTNAADVRVAARVAEALEVEWQLFHLGPPQGKDLVQLLDLKSGANNLHMSFILPFFHQLMEQFGPGITYFTGDGGGDTLGVSGPYRRISTPQALLDYVIERYQIWPLDQVAALTRLPGQDIKAELAEHLASYPETAPDRKYKHFFCLEVATKMYHEGEDRNSHFFWSVTPLYSFEFFHYALNCPDRDKQGYRLYREFLAQLHPAVNGIDYADWQAPLSSLKFSLLYQAKNLTRRRPNLIRRLRWLLGHYDRVGPESNIFVPLRHGLFLRLVFMSSAFIFLLVGQLITVHGRVDLLRLVRGITVIKHLEHRYTELKPEAHRTYSLFIRPIIRHPSVRFMLVPANFR